VSDLRRAVILTALPAEYLAARSHLADCKEAEDALGTVYEVGVFAEGDWSVGVAEIGVGNETAAAAAERAITFFDPEVAFFVGVAGGIKDVKIGDVVAGTKLYGYESGKATASGLLPRPDVGESSYRMVQRARAESKKSAWLTRAGLQSDEAAVLVGPIAAGEKVVASKRSDTYRFLRAQYGDALAVEMEGRGFLAALHAHPGVSALVVRGISDLIEGKAQADESASQSRAASSAAAFAFQVLSAIPRNGASESHGTITSHHETATPLDGWEVVDQGFLDGFRRDLNGSQLDAYFNGALPTWSHALSACIVKRQLVEAIRDECESSRVSGAGLHMSLILGAAAEGKSTALLQAAVLLADQAHWQILWRPGPDVGIDAQDVAQLPRGAKQWLLVIDDADTVVAPLMLAVRTLHQLGRSDVQILACARDSEWRLSGGSTMPWSSCATLSTHLMRGLAYPDSLAIVASWDASRGTPAGREADNSLQSRAMELVSKAKGEGAPSAEGSFFGGILRARFSPDGLVDHVRDMMNRLDAHKLDSGFSLRDAFLFVACCHAIGLPGLDHRVLADLLAVDYGHIRSLVELPLGDEAAAVRSGTALLTRHRSIAESAVVLAPDAFSLDLGELYASIVWQTIKTTQGVLGTGGPKVWPHGEVVHCRVAILERLPSAIPKPQRLAVCVAAAKSAVEAEPARLSYAIDLARAYKTAGMWPEALQLCQSNRLDAEWNPDYSTYVRSFYGQWGVSAGGNGDQLGNAWLSLIALSDGLDVPLSFEHVAYALSQVGYAWMGLSSSAHDGQVIAVGLRSCSVLGPLSRPPAHLIDFFRRQREFANELGAPNVSGCSSAIPLFTAAAEATERLAQGAGKVGAGQPSGLTFSKMTDMLCAEERANGRRGSSG